MTAPCTEQRAKIRRSAPLGLCLVAACAAGDAEPLGGQEQAIVYGPDDRTEVFEALDPALRDLATSAVVALMPPRAIDRAADGTALAPGVLTAAAYGLCSDERFAEQPAAAICTGVLIDSDLVLTAAHCLSSGASDGSACGDQVYVFDYRYEARDQLAALSEASVYGCREVLVHAYSAPGEVPRLDFAVVRLDRPVAVARKPVAIARRAPGDGDPLTTVGFPIGVPAKIDASARVVAARSDHADYFTLSSDVFEGSSGSPVLDSAHELVGVLAAGGADFMQDGAGCARALVVPEPQAPLFWERATYAARALDALCASSRPSQRICGSNAEAVPEPSAASCSAMRRLRAPGPFLLLSSVCALGLGARRRARGQRPRQGGHKADLDM